MRYVGETAVSGIAGASTKPCTNLTRMWPKRCIIVVAESQCNELVKLCVFLCVCLRCKRSILIRSARAGERASARVL